MSEEPQPKPRPQSRWTASELRLLEELAQEKHRQKIARQRDSSNKVTLSWRQIGEQVGGRDAAAAQARYNALLRQRKIKQEVVARSSPSLSQATSNGAGDDRLQTRTPQSPIHEPLSPYLDFSFRGITPDNLIDAFELEDDAAICGNIWNIICGSVENGDSEQTSRTPARVENQRPPAASTTTSETSARTHDNPRITTLRIKAPLERPSRVAGTASAAKTQQHLNEQMALEQELGGSTTVHRSPGRHTMGRKSVNTTPRADRVQIAQTENNTPVAPMGTQQSPESSRESTKDAKKALDLEAIEAHSKSSIQADKDRQKAAEKGAEEKETQALDFEKAIEYIKSQREAKRKADDAVEQEEAKRVRLERLRQEYEALIAEG